MAWFCFYYHCVSRLVFINGTMDVEKYVNILAKNLEQSVSDLSLSEFLFQRDNDPKHTSSLAKSFLKNNHIKTLGWPSNHLTLTKLKIFGL